MTWSRRWQRHEESGWDKFAEVDAAGNIEDDHLKRYEKFTIMGSKDREGYNFGDKLSISAGQHNVGKLKLTSGIQAAEDSKALLLQARAAKAGNIRLLSPSK